MHIWAFVKWFNITKGFGFLDAKDGKGDILLHVNVLRAFGVSSVAEGARVQVRVETTARGRVAAEVCDIQPPITRPPTPGAGPGAGAREVVRPGQGLRVREYLRPA